MIRGHLDFASRTRIEGWLYSERLALAGARVLAFADQECVGEGRIDVFREDLHRAGLGDGIAGFSFFIQLKPGHDPRTLHVQLEGSDLVLRPEGCVISPAGTADDPRHARREAQSLSWMLGRGWLAQRHYDALRLLGQFGAYRQTLPDDAGADERAAEVQELLQLNARMDLVAEVREELWAEDVDALRAEVEGRFPGIAPVVALWAPWTNTLNVREASHLGAATSTDTYNGVDYDFGGPILLWLNLHGGFHVPTGGFTCPVTAYLPARP